MRNIRTRWPAVLEMAAMVILAGCPAPTLETPENDGGGTGTIEESSTLFELDSEHPRTYEFETNDTRYEGGSGYTFWGLTGDAQEPFAERTVRMTKYSGNATAGYGIVICHGTASGGDETMLVVMINVSREYIVGEVVGAQFFTLVPWATSLNLRYGLNQTNTVRVARDAESGDFTLYLNGTKTAVFRDDEAPYHTGGGNGLIAVVSPLDEFPETSVRVTFEEL